MKKRELARKKRHNRIRRRIAGTAERPRLFLYRSLNNIFVTVIDDTAGKILYAVSTVDKGFRKKAPGAGGNIKAADALGVFVAEKMKEKGLARIIFDRSGYLYHGRVKALADALRKGGLEF